MNVSSFIRGLASPLSRDGARILVDQGLRIINTAIESASGGWFSSDLPGGSARQDVLDHLQWHSDNVGSGSDAYPSDADLRKWAIQAVVEYNAVVQGNATMSQAADALFADVIANLRAIPEVAGEIVASVAAGAGEVAGKTAIGIIKGLIWNPFGAAVLLLGGGAYGYYVYRQKKAKS